MLAKAAGMSFIDTDLLIQRESGLLLPEFIEKHGVARFLDFEAALLSSLSCSDTVVATGGSAVCRENAMEHLKSLGKIVYIKLSPKTLTKRVKDIKTRGIAAAPGESINDIYAARAPLYLRYADIVFDAENLKIEESVSLLEELINEEKR